MIIAIDGPAGTGKTTVAKLLAKKLKFEFFDTGAMYRSITYAIIKNKIEPENEEAVRNLLKGFVFETKKEGDKISYFVNQEDVTDKIRMMDVTSLVSIVSAKRYVREVLITIQRDFARNKDLVCEGRDMGTVVFPNAYLKVFLTAKASIRAERRFKELVEKYPQQIESLDKTKIFEEIQKRDKIDSTREISPLKRADDAILVDTSKLSIDQVIERIFKGYQKAYLYKMKKFYRFVRAFSGLVLKIFYRLKIYGKENVRFGAGIIASNHTSFYDPCVIAFACRDEAIFLARETLFKNRFFAKLIKSLNTYPISDQGANTKTFRTISKFLKNDKKVVIFPEGTRSATDEIGKILPGVGFIVQLTKATIYPMYIHGAGKVWGRDRKIPKLFGKISCVFGSPIPFSEFKDLDKKEIIEAITARLDNSWRSLKEWCEKGFKGPIP